MENLDNYIEYIKTLITQDMKEEEKIMLVYIDLGKQLFYDIDFKFGNRKKREEIFRTSGSDYKLDEIFENKKIVCRTSSKILEYILKNLGINITTEIIIDDNQKYHHTYNIIYPKDKSEPYIIDLQDDLENIQFHTLTKSFGLSLENPKEYVISRQKQKEIHKKIGYISDKNPYTEEYLYLLKQTIDCMNTPFEKIDFVLKNIEPIDNIPTKYWERGWRHKQIIDILFSNTETRNKLHRVECYKLYEGNNKQYINCYYAQIKEEIYVYLYDEEKNEYVRYDIEQFAKKMIEENIEITREQKIPKLNNILNKLKNSNIR